MPARERTDHFFFQAEDGIRDGHVTGVQTCALPISSHATLLTNDISEQREKELIFGPILLQEKTIYFRQKWTEEKAKLKHTIAQMKKARMKNVSKIMQFEKELKWIEEVLS